MHRFVFVGVLLFATLLLGYVETALMVFQIRERLGFDPIFAVHLGSIASFLSHILAIAGMYALLKPDDSND